MDFSLRLTDNIYSLIEVHLKLVNIKMWLQFRLTTVKQGYKPPGEIIVLGKNVKRITVGLLVKGDVSSGLYQAG